ncbi:MAG: DUF4386 domain-containing protein [Chloroflexi bacterium]|nr:MAG: DUF4386 domain-containing protein [Chloroflexota bacterium]
MKATQTEDPTVGSPRAMARIMGVFEALEGTASAFGQVGILGRLTVHGDAAATARNILANEGLFRVGFAASVLGVAFHIAWALLFYYLFRPVNRTLASLATFIILVGCAMQALTAFFYLTPLLVLQAGHSLSGLNTPQLALALINLNGLAFEIDLIFFGFWCVLAGYLILRSTFMPRILGVLLMLDGIGWALYLWPPLATFLFPAIAVASGLAEAPLQLWLIVFGVNPQRWREQARAAGKPGDLRLAG